jgi:hypothetical protein
MAYAYLRWGLGNLYYIFIVYKLIVKSKLLIFLCVVNKTVISFLFIYCSLKLVHTTLKNGWGTQKLMFNYYVFNMVP